MKNRDNHVDRFRAATLALLVASGCQFGWEELLPQRAEPTATPPLSELCGPEQATRVAELVCTTQPEICQSRVKCCNESNQAASYQACLQEETNACREGVVARLSAGACFFVEAHARNEASGCNAPWVTALGQCTLPTLAEFARADAACEPIWSDGTQAEGAACKGYFSECAQPEEPGLQSLCRWVSFESGYCEVIPNVQEGARCEPGLVCKQGLRCLSTGVCGEPRPLGAACGLGDDCESHQCAGGLCTDPEVHGCTDAACPPLLECKEGACVRIPRAISCEGPE